MDDFHLAILANAGLLSFLGLSCWILLVAGMVSFGQQAFFAIGAYVAAFGTVTGALPLPLALAAGLGAGAAAGTLLGLITRRLGGFRFAVASLAFAEAVRLGLDLLVLRVPGPGGGPVGPGGTDGFGGIRLLYESGTTAGGFVALIWGTLAAVLVLLTVAERTGPGRGLRMIGEDPVLAEALGRDPGRLRLAAAAAAGAVAALGGGLFAHYTTYVEPSNFGLMIGIHGLAYALIGGLGTAVAPLLGVGFDIGLLEGARAFQSYRMVVFGGAVAVFLIWRPRGILDEALVARLALLFRRLADRAPGPGPAGARPTSPQDAKEPT
ncbi:MAG: branched-chain amino acid ABC transporter permease [Azospirillaceae bacterium]